MKFLKVFLVIFVASVILPGNCPAAVEEKIPEVGFVKNNGSNVRAGDNMNFEILCELKKGDTVKIIDKRYSWFKIVLPKKAHLYIKNDFVDILEKEAEGVVTANRVNLRAGPDTKYSILGQVSEEEILKVISEKDGWYEIEPPENTAGWIHSGQITFEPTSIETEKISAKRPFVTQKRGTRSITLKTGAPEPKGNLIFSTQAN
ncbi:MAG: SH3 domain-containing protein [Candidatus Omnitrophica bacterium]|nr:SH3 domain-containing protein [Candidatus Omnitrophota bacterium]